MLELTTGVVFLMSSLYGSGANDGQIQTISERAGNGQATTTETRTFTDSNELETYLRQEYFDTPILVDIARCESEMRQYTRDGKVLRGRATPDDIGVMQVNEFYHGETAKKMGLDIYTVPGNVAYAKYLYKKYGTSPWSASKPCWSKAQSKTLAKK